MKIKIAKLWSGPPGETEKYELDEEISLGKEIISLSNLKADLLLIKLKEEISVILTNIEITVEQTCNKCLQSYHFLIQIPSIEREFFMQVPKEIGDPFDIFLIDKKEMMIDLTEMLRQEIILHFPFIPVCSEHCKGLCQLCGKNLNEKNKHSCSKESKNIQDNEGMHKPFANLKDLIK